jgi:CubicO group peptidase (beta-lactamase class C family)
MKRLALATVAATLLVVGGAALAQDEVSTVAPQTRSELINALDDVLEASPIPGAQIVLIEDGEVSLSYTFGVSNREAETPVTQNTVFRAGSISKSFIGVALMMAAEDGLLSLDMRVADAAPDVEFINPWEDTDPLTLAHVMEHTAGFYDISLQEFLMNDPGITIAEGLAINPRNRISRWRPGTYQSYANSGPPIAAHALELVRDQDYDTILRESVLRPLGMEGSDLQLTRAVERRISNSYTESLDGPVPYFHILMRPSGALNTTALELSQFVRMLIGRGAVDGVRLLSPESVDRIERSETLEAVQFYGLDATYGLGNGPVYHDSLVFRGHGGSIDAFNATYAYAPELRDGYVIMLNGDDSRAAQTLAETLANYILRDFEPDLPTPYDVDQDELAAYAGYYYSRTPRGRFDEAMQAFASPTRATYSADTGLVVAGAPRVPSGEYTMRRLERAESSFVRALDRTYRHELRYSSITYIQAPFWQYLLRLLLPIGIAVGAAMALGYEILRIPLFVFRVIRKKPTPPKRRGPPLLRPLAILSGLSVAAIAYLFYDVGQMHYTQMAQVASLSPLTLAIFTLTIAAPFFAAVGLWTAVLSEGEAGPGKRGYHILAMSLILAGWLWLSQWGWIGLQVWTF